MELKSHPHLLCLQTSLVLNRKNISPQVSQVSCHLWRVFCGGVANQWQTAPLAAHNKVVIDLASPRTSVQTLPEAKESPMWGFGFTLWQSKHSLWAGKKHFTLQMGLGRMICFLREGLGISRWLEVSTLFVLMLSDRLPPTHSVISEE